MWSDLPKIMHTLPNGVSAGSWGLASVYCKQEHPKIRVSCHRSTPKSERPVTGLDAAGIALVWVQAAALSPASWWE